MKFLDRLFGRPLARRRQTSLGSLEHLEPRVLLSAISTLPLDNFHRAATFVDGDGTRVLVTMRGPGSGSITLDDNNPAGIDRLELTGTTGQTSLTIHTFGGEIPGVTLDELNITGKDGRPLALGSLVGRNVSLVDGGEFSIDGSVGTILLDDVGPGAQIDVQGSVGRLIVGDMLGDSSVEVTDCLQTFVAANLDQANISADKIDTLLVTGIVDDSTIHAGAGGLNQGYFADIFNSTIAADSHIGSIIVADDLLNSTIVANMDVGYDGDFGTIDDTIVHNQHPGTIGTVAVFGGTIDGGGNTNQFIASGDIGTVWSRDMDVANPTLWEFAASSYIKLNVQQAVANATGFSDDQIWIAVFGQEIDTPGPGVVPPVGTTYYLVASDIENGKPVPLATAGLNPGDDTPNQATLPSSTLAAWDGNLSLPVPAPGKQYTGRIVISVGAPVQAQVVTSDGTVAAPSSGNPTDPSNGTYYDFLEFTVTNFNGVPNLDIDTSQVDAFGLPIKLQFFKDAAGTQPFNYAFTGNITAGSNVITGIRDTTNLGEGSAVTGTGIPEGATIQSVVASTPTTAGSVTLNKNATVTQNNVSFTAAAAGPVGVQATRDSILALTGTNSYLSFIVSKITPTNQAARPFLESFANQPTTAATSATGIVANVSAGASNTVRITSVNHGLTTGDVITIDNVLGATEANGTFVVTVVDPDTFDLQGTVFGTVGYIGGGSWMKGTITGASNAGPIVITTSSTTGLANGDLVRVEGILGNTAANGLFTISNVTPTSFTLVDSHGNGAYTMGGTWSVYKTPPVRLASPKDVVESLINANSDDPLNNYFNETIDAFFLKYYNGSINSHVGGGQTFELVSLASGQAVTYSGHTVREGNNYVLRLNATTGTPEEKAVNYDIYYPFFETNLPDPEIYQPVFYIDGAQAPSWIIAKGQQYESASQMVFGCDAVFADNVARGFVGTQSAILGDLENSISAAFNRGIILNAASTWGDQTTWYQVTETNGGIYNYWVEFWHQDGLTFGNLAYAFPYDDKFGASTNLNQNNVGLASITLGSWSSNQTATTTTFTNFPVSAPQGGQVTLTAKVAGTGTPTGTVTFYIDGVPINSQNSSSSPPLQPVVINGQGEATITATLPELPDGSISHTYTVTAVYSGDATHLPGIAYQALPLIGSNGDFPVTTTPGAGTAGSQVKVTAQLPGSSPSGTVQFYFSRQDGSEPQVLTGAIAVSGSTVEQTVTLPSTVLSFTGSTTTGQPLVQDILNVVDFGIGQTVSGTNIPAGSTITGFTPPILFLSENATETGVVTLKVGDEVFTATIAAGSNQVVGVLNATGLAAGATVEGAGIPAGTTIQTVTAGNITLSQNATGTGSVNLTSNGVGQPFRISAVYKPTTGDEKTGMTVFSITA